jgi:hypothetical protein
MHEGEIVTARSMHFRNKYKICLGKDKERESSLGLGVDGLYISNWILESQILST